MTDIVKRLRDAEAHAVAVIVEGATSHMLDLFREAADEIDRLTDELARLHDGRSAVSCLAVGNTLSIF